MRHLRGIFGGKKHEDEAKKRRNKLRAKVKKWTLMCCEAKGKARKNENKWNNAKLGQRMGKVAKGIEGQWLARLRDGRHWLRRMNFDPRDRDILDWWVLC